MFLLYFEIEICKAFFYLFGFFLILFGLFSHQFLLMFKVIFNVSFLILNYFVPSSSLLFLLVKHHLVGATSTSSLESLPLHWKASSVGICTQPSVLLRGLYSLRRRIHLVVIASLIKLLFIVVAITILQNSFFCLHSKSCYRSRLFTVESSTIAVSFLLN